MKIYIIQKLGWEYNNEYFRRPECDGGQVVKAYRDRENAKTTCLELNRKEQKENTDSRWPMVDHDGQPVTDFYEVVEVDVADEDVEEYAAARQKLDDTREKALQAARAHFRNGAAKLFGEYHDLQSFGWCQFTPHFADGDVPRFGVNYDEPDINGVSGGDTDNGVEWDRAKRECVQVREPSLEHQLQQPVCVFLRSFSSDDMESMFGDDVQVTVHRDGTIEKDEYSHD